MIFNVQSKQKNIYFLGGMQVQTSRLSIVEKLRDI
jgi:hypothetical protein